MHETFVSISSTTLVHLEAVICTTACLPDPGQASQVDIPLLFSTLGLDDVHALGVAADL
jgi:hypothetical protein